MNQKFNQKVIFLAVYITEAHAKDEWPCGKSLSFCDQPKTTEERCELASIAQKKCSFTFPFLVDSIQNEFEQSYSCWPFRFFGYVNGKLSLKAQPDLNGFAYDINTLNSWLENLN